jgi:hypothetical protein
MRANERATIGPGDRLPEISLRAVPGGQPVRVRPARRRSSLFILVHGLDCERCVDFIRLVAAGSDLLREWDADPVVLLPDPLVAEPRAGPLPMLSDSEARFSGSLGVRAPACVIVDQWGEVHLKHEAGEDHSFAAFSELVDWARFLAIQCPECQGEAY